MDRLPVTAAGSGALVRCLLVGVRGHGGEEIYSTRLRDDPPPGVTVSATFDFGHSCSGARCRKLAEGLLNRLVHPWAAPDTGFRVLEVAPAIDLVHVHTHPVVLGGLGGRPVVFSAGSSHYHYLRDYAGWSEEAIRRRYTRGRAAFRALGALDSLLNHAPITVSYTFSEDARSAYLAHGVPPGKIRVLYPGFDVPAVPLRAGRDTVTFLFLGRSPKRKGGDLVLGAFRRLREEMPSARLLYVSDELPTPGDGVEAMPLVPPAEVAALYARADVFVSPARAEGFGFTNVEAQGFGLPVISTRLGAVPEVVADGMTGILVDRGDGDGVLSAMRRLAIDATRREEMGAAARARFLAHFSLDRFHAGLRALYDEALDRAARR
jgi:glycosyltransferase involved in cell wall biosynthesis